MRATRSHRSEPSPCPTREASATVTPSSEWPRPSVQPSQQDTPKFHQHGHVEDSVTATLQRGDYVWSRTLRPSLPLFKLCARSLARPAQRIGWPPRTQREVSVLLIQRHPMGDTEPLRFPNGPPKYDRLWQIPARGRGYVPAIRGHLLVPSARSRTVSTVLPRSERRPIRNSHRLSRLGLHRTETVR